MPKWEWKRKNPYVLYSSLLSAACRLSPLLRAPSAALASCLLTSQRCAA